MHLELLIPGLLAMASGSRLPALELLLARGRSTRDAPCAREDWLGRAFGVDDEPLPAGALTWVGAGGDAGDAFWLRADPLHLEVRNDGVSFTPADELDLRWDEAEALAAALERHFGGDPAWRPVRAGCWCLRTATPLPLDAAAPGAAIGAGSVLPQGAGAKRAHALITEAQMLLHGHAVNAARERRGALAVNSVWLWGAGRAPRGASAHWSSVLADDPLAAGLARLAGAHCAPVPADAAAWLERAPADGRILCLLERAQPAALERRWFAPLLGALRSGRIGMVSVHVPDAGRTWETTRADLRRFWRRARPLPATP
jgi:hypothetical protein